MSSGGHVSSVTSGVNFHPPRATTVSLRSATSSTSNGDGSSRRASSFRRVTENTSNGPQKSRTSTSGKMRMPTRLRSMTTSASGSGDSVERNVVSASRPKRKRPTVSKWDWRPWSCCVTAWMSRKPRSKALSMKIEVAPPACYCVGGREPDQHALAQREHARAAHGPPDLLEGAHEESARRAQLRLGLRHLGLDHGVLGEGPPASARCLFRGERPEGIQHAS